MPTTAMMITMLTMAGKNLSMGRVASRRPAAQQAADRRDALIALLPDREHPHDTTLRHVLLPAEQVGEQALLERRIDAPARGDGDVLHAVDGERRGRRGDTGVGAELPQHFTGARVERAEVPVVGAT